MKKLIARTVELIGWFAIGGFATLALLLVIPGGCVLFGVLIASEKLEVWADDK